MRTPKEPSFDSIGAAKSPPRAAEKSKNLYTVQHCFQKDLDLPIRKAAKKPLINERMKKQWLSLQRNMYIGQLNSREK